MPARAHFPEPETIGLKALAFLAGNSEALERFVAVSGTNVESVRARVAEPEFLASVLDYLLANEPLLLAFCGAESLEPRAVHLAAARLGG